MKTVMKMFNVAKFFIDRPVLATSINIVISVLGIVSIGRLKIREYPSMERNTINVSMEYGGASVDVMESQIANRFEETLASVESLENMRTKITQGQCDIQLEFKIDRNIDSAANDVEARLRRIRSDLPENLREPTITKTDPTAYASFSLALSGDGYNSSELSDKMVRYVKNSIESIPGVAAVTIPGQSGTSTTYAIDVYMRPNDMAALKLTPDDVHRALATQSFVQPAGDVIIGDKTYRMTVRAGLTTIPEFEQIIVKEKMGRIIRLSDVADVKLSEDDKKQRLRYNGQVVSLCYVKIQPTANIMEIAKSLKKRIPDIMKSLPDKNMKLDLVLDNSIHIDASVTRLIWTIIEAVILVAIVILLFLKSFRSTVIPLVTIPICIFSGFFIMYTLGFSLNIITLLAMLLAVGLVVDDCIVFLEKFSENIDHGMSPVEACISGMDELQGAVIGMTLTLISVYLPISLLTSAWGKFFNEFALTLAGMVLVSGLVAFVLTPTMSASILRRTNKGPALPIVAFNQLFESIKGMYYDSLKLVVRNPNAIVGGALLLTIGSLIVGKYFLTTIAEPESDKGIVYLDLSTGRSGLASIEPILEKIEGIKSNPAVKGIISDFSSNSDKAHVQFILNDDIKKRISANEFIEQMKKQYESEFSDLIPQYYTPSSPLAESNRFGVTIRTNKSYDELEEVGSELSRLLSVMPGQYKTRNVQVSRTRPEKTYNVTPNRDRAYLVGVRLDDVRNAIKWITRGNPPADRYERDGKQYPVRLWVSEDSRKDLEIVKQFYVRSTLRQSRDEEIVSLRDLVDIQETKIRPLMLHDESMRAFELYCEFAKRDLNLIDAYKEFEKRALKVLPPGYSVSPSRNIKKLIEEGNNFFILIGLALVFVYLVMAALFESFIDPFIVLCTVPLAVSWALLSLWAFPDGSLNAYSYIGILTLIGLITKHGILLVLFFNEKAAITTSLQKAAVEAALERFRPIIMTTLAMVLGALPLILRKGSGYEGPRQVGIVIVGGLTFGTIMTIFVVPCLCIIFRKFSLQKKQN